MKTITTVQYANSAETGDDRSILINFDDGTTELIKQSKINDLLDRMIPLQIAKLQESRTKYTEVRNLVNQL